MHIVSTADNNPLSLSDLEPSWVRSLRAANRSERTIDSYVLALSQLADYLGDPPVTSVTADDVRDFLAKVLEDRASATARQRHASLRQFFVWAWEESEIAINPMAKVRPPKVVEKPVEVLSPDQLRALFKAASGTGFTDRRDTAILSLLLDCGLRLGEISTITLSDIDWDAETVTVTGKGDKIRTVAFGRETARDPIGTIVPAAVIHSRPF